LTGPQASCSNLSKLSLPRRPFLLPSGSDRPTLSERLQASLGSANTPPSLLPKPQKPQKPRASKTLDTANVAQDQLQAAFAAEEVVVISIRARRGRRSSERTASGKMVS